jgi:hypothetical protein
VAKQALTSIVATSQPGLTTRYSELQALLLNRNQRASLGPLRLWCYLMANQVGMYTGVTVAFSVERRKGHLVAGFAFWPVAWLLTIGDVAVDGVADVSGWTELDEDRTPANVTLPCQWTGMYPGDFRSPEEVAQGAAWQARSQ